MFLRVCMIHLYRRCVFYSNTLGSTGNFFSWAAVAAVYFVFRHPIRFVFVAVSPFPPSCTAGWYQALSEGPGAPPEIVERSSALLARMERACLAHQARCPPQELGAFFFFFSSHAFDSPHPPHGANSTLILVSSCQHQALIGSCGTGFDCTTYWYRVIRFTFLRNSR